MWATETDFLETVKRGWGATYESKSITARINNCQSTILTWAGERFHKIPHQISRKRERLNQLKSHTCWSVYFEDIQKLEKEIDILSMKMELYWKQRSRVNWLANGDRNSKYFHRQASLRRANNFISGLVSSHGDWCTDQSSMSSIIIDYFPTLFTSQNPTASDMSQVLDGVMHMIDDNLNSVLCAPFVEAEVRQALFDMHPDKAPGPDGMSVFFYQQ